MAREPGIRLWRDPVLGLGGTELSCGSGIRFGPLIRNEATIVAVVSGDLRYRTGGREGVARPGQVVLAAAGEAFSGEAESGWSWRAFYPDLDSLADMASRLPAGSPQRGPQPAEGAYVQRLIVLHRAIEANLDNPQARQQAFADAIALVLTHGALPPGWPGRPRPSNGAVRRAIDCVKAQFCNPALSVADLAAAAGYSPYYFMRCFQVAVGVTAHAYIVQCRVHAARALLADGVPAAEVAHAAGFADQSHLIRQFKAIHGVTPGQYADGCRRRSQHRSAAPGTRLGTGMPG